MKCEVSHSDCSVEVASMIQLKTDSILSVKDCCTTSGCSTLVLAQNLGQTQFVNEEVVDLTLVVG